MKLIQIFFVEAAREVLRRIGGGKKELLHESDKELGVRVLVLRGLSLVSWVICPKLLFYFWNETSF